MAWLSRAFTIRPELDDDDVAWLNAQQALLDHPVRYVRRVPPPARIPSSSYPGRKP